MSVPEATPASPRPWRQRALTALAFVALAAIVVFALWPPADSSMVRFAVYRPSAAQFQIDRGAAAGDALDYSRSALEAVPLGTAGAVGLACPRTTTADNAKPDLRAFANGLWFLSGGRAPAGGPDFALGQPGDLPFCADFDGDGVADSGVFRDGHWYIATKTGSGDVAISFTLGTAGDRPVVVNAPGTGNATNRRNVVYGVYRKGAWFLDTNGDGEVDAMHAFGGLPQDVPLLIPRWSRERGAGRGYSLAIFRDGTWYVRPDPDAPQTLTFGLGQPGDVPAVLY